MNFEAIVGLEIHVELKTKTKMFSRAPIDFSAEPNTLVTTGDLALPGTLPLVNKEAVVYGIRLANALNMDIAKTLLFDQKNYFYSDLPKRLSNNSRSLANRKRWLFRFKNKQKYTSNSR